MVQVNDEYYVIANSDARSAIGFASIDEGLHFFTDAYDKVHQRSETPYNGAFVSLCQSQPRIIDIDLEVATTKLFDEAKGIRPVKFGGSLGFLNGLTCNRPKNLVEEVYNSGTAPEFISDTVKEALSR
jgi:hypothetical protein